MSYDLYLFPRKLAPSLEGVRKYFRKRKNYKIEDKNEEFVEYFNDVTGVSFQIELYEPGKSEEDYLEVWNEFPLGVWMINYLKPSPFALEAILEIEAFCKHFDCLTGNPQYKENAPSKEKFDSKKFLSQFIKSSSWATKAIREKHPELVRDYLAYPREDCEKIWKWNYYKNEIEARFQVDVFFPRVLIGLRDDDKTLFTFSVMTDSVPTAIPLIDFVLFYREDLAPSKTFLRKAEPDQACSSREDFLKVYSENCQFVDNGNPFYIPTYEDPKSAKRVRKFVKSLPTSKLEFKSVSFGALFDKEFLD